MKTNKTSVRMLITSIVCLLPIILSLVLYDELPDRITIHWDAAGNPDNDMPKAFVAFGLPVLLLLINISVQWIMQRDPKREKTSHSLQLFIAWLVPIVTIVFIPVSLFVSMGDDLPIFLIVSTILGMIFIVIGNYLPKNRQNFTIGLKLPWTLHSENVWNKTHRLAGRLFMLCGIVLLVGGFLSQGSAFWIMLMAGMVVVLLVVVPTIYSYTLYKKEL